MTWYGGRARRLQLASGTAVWYHGGKLPVTIRWVLVRDPKGRFEPQALLSTDPKLSARQVVTYFVRRWSMETTFQEARLYLGLEGQRQWNDLAAARTTPVRLGLFSFVALIVHGQPNWQQAFRRSAWYAKARPTFADALAQVRRALWRQLGFACPRPQKKNKNLHRFYSSTSQNYSLTSPENGQTGAESRTLVSQSVSLTKGSRSGPELGNSGGGAGTLPAGVLLTRARPCGAGRVSDHPYR